MSSTPHPRGLGSVPVPGSRLAVCDSFSCVELGAQDAAIDLANRFDMFELHRRVLGQNGEVEARVDGARIDRHEVPWGLNWSQQNYRTNAIAMFGPLELGKSLEPESGDFGTGSPFGHDQHPLIRQGVVGARPNLHVHDETASQDVQEDGKKGRTGRDKDRPDSERWPHGDAENPREPPESHQTAKLVNNSPIGIQ